MPTQATVTRPQTATERAAIRAAWNEYRRETRGLDEILYREVEPWAWARLQATLRRLRS